MVKTLKLEAVTRTEENGKAKNLRNKGLVPGVLYGSGADNQNVKLKQHDLNKVYEVAGESSLVDLDIDGQESVKVIIKDIQRDNLKDTIKHVDFYRINMKQAIEVEVPIVLVGEAKAVKDLGGTLNQNLDTLQVKCLPGELLENIEVDITPLETFEDSIKVSDIKVPESFEVMNGPEDSVASVLEVKEEVIEEPVEEEAAEGEATAEGEKAEGEAKAEDKPAEGGGQPKEEAK